ncbi:MAG TPA: glucose 1-dehydrogenase [Candidatus Binataceae bacterium]|nr:glucose 1-dehydrogenase [Candidatus Binataceae bacterium]
MNLTDKVAIVTGAGSGIGRAVALRLGAAGAKVIAADYNEEAAAKTCAELKNANVQAISRRTDVSQTGEVQQLVAFAVRTFGRLDCAVNNAGIQGELASTAECSEENWDRIVDTNLKGVFLCMKYELREMLRHSSGAIVNIASNFGLVGSPQMPAYSASKHGVVGLTKTAAIEVAARGIRVNAVCPGPTMTPLAEAVIKDTPGIIDAINSRLPIGRMASPEEIAQAVAWLCSDEAVFVVGGIFPVDGGYVAQ